METTKFTEGQRVYDTLDSYVFMIITDISRCDIDNEPIYEVSIYAKNTGRHITNSICREWHMSATPNAK